MKSHRVLSTMETTSISIPSLKSHTTNIKRLNDKRILVHDKAFMHQYIMQLHTISFKKEMAVFFSLLGFSQPFHIHDHSITIQMHNQFNQSCFIMINMIL